MHPGLCAKKDWINLHDHVSHSIQHFLSMYLQKNGSPVIEQYTNTGVGPCMQCACKYNLISNSPDVRYGQVPLGDILRVQLALDCADAAESNDHANYIHWRLQQKGYEKLSGD